MVHEGLRLLYGNDIGHMRKQFPCPSMIFGGHDMRHHPPEFNSLAEMAAIDVVHNAGVGLCLWKG